MFVFVFASAGIVAFWLMWPSYIYEAGIPDLENRGLYGDQFGGLNALFAGLAFAALVVALLMQHEELRQQSKELRLQRNELRETNRQAARQGDILESQHNLLARQYEPSVALEAWPEVGVRTESDEYWTTGNEETRGYNACRIRVKVLNERPVPFFVDVCVLSWDGQERRSPLFSLTGQQAERIEFGQAAFTAFEVDPDHLSSITKLYVIGQSGDEYSILGGQLVDLASKARQVASAWLNSADH